MTDTALLPHHLEALHASAISDAVIEARGYGTVMRPTVADSGPRELLKRLKFPGWVHKEDARFPGLLIPLYSPIGGQAGWQYRPDVTGKDRDGKTRKYANPVGQMSIADVHPASRDAIIDPTVPLWITEGVKKADALRSVGECAAALCGRHPRARQGSPPVPAPPGQRGRAAARCRCGTPAALRRAALAPAGAAAAGRAVRHPSQHRRDRGGPAALALPLLRRTAAVWLVIRHDKSHAGTLAKRSVRGGQTELVTELEKPNGHAMAVEAVGATFAVILAAGTGPLAPVVAAVATPLTRRMVQLVAAEWRRKSDVIADTALRASGLGDPEDFCSALVGDPDMIALTQKILWAASVSGDDRRLQALGTLLGRAAGRPGGDRLDETQLLVSALADLEAPHLIVLDVIADPAPDDAQVRSHPGSELAESEPVGWLPEQVQEQVNLDPQFMLACLNALTRHGLASTLGVLGGGQRFRITQLGRAIAIVMHGPGSPSDG